jgi:carboxymethylenebutenolidase
MGTFIQLDAADGQSIPAYVAQASTPAKAAVVVIQEIFGVNAHIREVADAYAKEGYLAIAPAMFHRLQANVELGYDEADRNAGMALKTAAEALPAKVLLEDIQRAIDHAHQICGGKVGVVGYCWGGLLTWRAACLLSGLSAAAPYYGGGMTSEAESARESKVPLMAHFAEEDKWISMASVNAFKLAHPKAVVHTYPADHGFNCNHRCTWQADAAALAQQRTFDFFKANLL